MITASIQGYSISNKTFPFFGDKCKIFQPLFTTKPTYSRTRPSLSLSYDIVKGHSGEIELKLGIKMGSEFIIKLSIEQ